MTTPTGALKAVINPLGDDYPDDDSIKNIILQVDGLLTDEFLKGKRHVLLHWQNGIKNGDIVTQILHLTGGCGAYRFYHPTIKLQPKESHSNNTFFDLGPFTRIQRDQIILLAKNVGFERKSIVNDCTVWMQDLLAAMVDAGLLSQDKFDEIDRGIPLSARVPEIRDSKAA
ncbi:hypothetical protein K488DRAFT_85370 [Vararia minispora EC-137]|uniref:Uncharacterized protein n=1 Tax=Vararia minispora EC-137 TaxID=1314806 RepID=A0ACB8QMM3_9AGAM|nr:hypothetical protein K488DRAFT_85370 [Vararia minispora EC-137]